MICISIPLRHWHSLLALFGSRLVAVDVQRRSVAVLIDLDAGYHDFTGFRVQGGVISIGDDLDSAWGLDPDFRASENVSPIVSDPDGELVPIARNRGFRKLYLDFRLCVCPYPLLVTPGQREARRSHGKTSHRNYVRKLIAPDVVERIQKYFRNSFPHDPDSPVFSHSHEDMRHGGWQARRFFRRWRACRSVSIPALLPP